MAFFFWRGRSVGASIWDIFPGTGKGGRGKDVQEVEFGEHTPCFFVFLVRGNGHLAPAVIL